MNTSFHIDLPRKQLERYSLGGLIAAAARDDKRELGFYRECSNAVLERSGQQLQTISGYLVPADYMRRDLQASAADGGYLVGSRLDFAGALYAASIVSRLPLRRASTTTNALLTVNTTAATSTWLDSEAASIADAAMAFGQRAAAPKTVSTVGFISKQLDLTSPTAAGFIEQQFASALATAVDTAFVSGSGASGEPTGLLTLAGTTSQSGTSLAYSGVCAMLGAAEGWGGTLHVLMGKDTAKLLRQRAKVTSGDPIFANGSIDGLPTIVSRAMPDAGMLVLDPTLITDVRFGALEVVVTPLASATAFRTGAIGVRLMESVNWMTDFPAAAAKATSIT